MPLGAAFHSLNLANPVAPTGPTFRGYVRPSSTTVVNYYNTSNTSLTSFTHSVGTVAQIKTDRLPGSNNQIVAIAGSSGRRVLHLNTATNTFTSIFISTAVTAITGCDIHMNETEGKFYVAFSSTTGTTANRMTLAYGNISTPTSALSSATLTQPGLAAQTVAWNPQGTILAVRTSSTIRTYTRSGDTVTLFGTSYSLAGGQTGANEKDLSWNYDGTVLANSNLNNASITRYTVDTTGALTSLGDTSVVSGGQNFPAFNPNSDYAGVMAIGAQVSKQIKIVYFNGNGGGTLASAPTTGYISTSDGAIQMRWSPTGDRLAVIETGGFLRYSFVYSSGSTATSSFVSGSDTTSGPGFDWVYY